MGGKCTFVTHIIGITSQYGNAFCVRALEKEKKEKRKKKLGETLKGSAKALA